MRSSLRYWLLLLLLGTTLTGLGRAGGGGGGGSGGSHSYGGHSGSGYSSGWPAGTQQSAPAASSRGALPW